LQPNVSASQSNVNEARRDEEELAQLLSDHAVATSQPNSAVTHKNFADSLFEQGKLEEAIAGYERALQIRPDFSGGHYGLEIALKAHGNLAQQRLALSDSDFPRSPSTLGCDL